MHYAVEAHTIVEIYALFLPMNALCRIAEIGCTIPEIRADCLYLAGKRCICFNVVPYILIHFHILQYVFVQEGAT